MKISNELLAAYAEGKVSTEERNSVRQYLAKNPQELESIMMMMDNDYELEVDGIDNDESSFNEQKQTSFHDIALSAAAFAPQNSFSPFSKSKGHCIKVDFNQQIDALIAELGI